jgi:membrane protease YdiL (CAAX protease family)
MINRLVERFGKTGFAAVSSIIWALPMAAWAGSADLSPVDRTATPTIALAIGVVMLIVWLVLIAGLRRVHVTSRQRRFDIGQMSPSEKRWTLACAAFATGLIAWLNAAATVDWGPLGSAIKAGEAGPMVFAAALALFAIVMVAGIAFTWRKESQAFSLRAHA